MDIKKDILWRIYLIYALMCLFSLVIIAQVIKLQYVEGTYWKSKADSLYTSYRNIEAIRGNIFASDGSLLAASIPIYEIRMDVNAESITDELFYREIDSLAFNLFKMFKDKKKERYKKELEQARRSGERYYLLHKNVSYTQLKEIKNWPILRLGKYKGGLIVEQKNVREKPFKILAERTIGSFNRNGAKLVGLEGAYNEYLSGVTGKRLMQRLSGNRWKPINNDNEIEPKDGNDIITTIDINIQDVTENALLKQLTNHNADYGCVVLMEVKTGEIKAIANLSRNPSGTYREDYNHAIGGSTEPGSTFKLASIIAALEDKLIDITDTVDTENGKFRYYDRIMKDSHEGGYGKITVQRAFEISSNVAISKIIYQNYFRKPQVFVNHLHRMHLNDTIGLEIPGETKPKIKNPKDTDWYGTTLPWMSVGYEVSLTPLQILTFYNAIANDATMVKPMFVKEIRHRGQLLKKYSTTVIEESICSKSTVEKAKILLEGVVKKGTATNLYNSNYTIAGKTGTTQIANERYSYKSDTTRYQASFVGYFPADNPKYSCIVVISAPSKGVYYANIVAGPVFKEIADKIYATRLEMHKELNGGKIISKNCLPFTNGYNKDILTISQLLDIAPTNNLKKEWVSKNSSRGENKVPDVIGMGVKDALYLLENAGLNVRINGRGKVVKQSINAESKIEKGNLIIIDLS